MLPPMNRSQAVRALQARPLAVLAGILVVAALGNGLLVGCGGKKTETETSSTPSTETATTPAPDTGAGGAMASDEGAKIYAEKCSLCHGPTGHGDGPGAAALNPKPRNHTDGSYMNARTDEQLLEVIKNGKGNMPPWGTTLTDEQMHAVLKHVRTLAVPPYQGS